MLWNAIKYTFIFLVLFLIGIYFLVQIPTFQNYIVRKVTTFLSEELHTTVSVGRVRLVFFQSVQLEDLLILDRNKDTLLYTKYLNASLNGGLVDLLDNKIDIKHISMSDLHANLVANGSKYDNNFQFLLNYIDNGHPDSLFSKPKKYPKQINLSFNTIELKNIDISYINVGKGNNFKINFDKLYASFSDFDINKNIFHVDEIKIERPNVAILDFAPKKYQEVVYTDPYQVLRQEYRKNRIHYPLDIEAQVVGIANGTFILENSEKPRKGNTNETIDFNHLNLSSINIALTAFSFTKGEIQSVINNIALSTGTEFNIRNLRSDDFKMTPGKMALHNFELTTDHSVLRDRLSLSYNDLSDFEDFINKVNLNGRFDRSVIAIQDIVAFNYHLRDDDFMRKNMGRVVDLSGNFQGNVNNLSVDNLLMTSGKSLIKGSFDLENITDINIAGINANIENAMTNARELENIIPGFKATPELLKLGTITYSGKYLGLIKNFKINGSFTTALGNGSADLSLDLSKGNKNAKYGGTISLQNFDLAALTNQQDLGRFSGTFAIENGTSLDLNHISANFKSNINAITYRGYNYKNITINGELKNKSFSGNLVLKDENADLDFTGVFDFASDKKVLNFKADIRRLSPDALNLSKTGLTYSGKINSDLTFSNIDDLNGQLHARGLTLTKIADNEFLKIDTLDFFALTEQGGAKKYTLNSDLLSGELHGRFRLEELANDIQRVFHYNHTKLANKFGIMSSDPFVYNHNFDFNFSIRNTKNLFNLLNVNLDKIQDGDFSGKFKNTDSTAYDLYLNANIPEIKNDQFSLKHFFIEGIGDQTKTEYFAFANSGSIGKSPLNQMDISADLIGDKINFNVKTPRVQDIVENLNIDADYTVEDNFHVLKFNQSKFDFLDDDWIVNENNLIKFDNNILNIENLEFKNETQRVKVNSFGTQGVNMVVENFSLGFLKGFLPADQASITGLGLVNVSIDSLFSLKNIKLNGNFDSIFINKNPLGKAALIANAKSLEDKLNVNMLIGEDEKQFTANGFITLDGYKDKDVPPKYLSLGVNATNYPIAISEAFLGDMISDTKGGFSTDLRVQGKFNDLTVKGAIDLKNFATTINYLGTRYYVTSYTVQLNNSLIDLDNLKLLDERGNIATVAGGIRHRKLKDFSTDLEINSDNFLLLKTTEKQNGLYYGTAAGAFTAKFNGPFDQMDIDINAVTGPRTEIFLPTNNQQDIAALDFIEFKNKFDTTIQKDIKKLRLSKGLALKMNLDINENATMKIIMNKEAGDAIKGRGNGHLELDIPRNGSLNMYGTFEVAEGEYQFTFYKLFNLSVINTPFIINKGGTIVWSGDPFAAQINIDAYYKGLNPSPYNFIYEYLPEQDRLIAEASKPTPVDLSLNLKGDLLKPIISFNIAFPQISPELKTYTDTKITYLQQNPNELSKQAAFLIAFKSFVPQNFSTQTGLTTLYNTLSELVSNQLNQVLSPLINESIVEGKILSNVDLKMSYNFYDANNSQSNGLVSRTGSEFQFGPRISMFDNRLMLNPGVKTGTNVRSTSYVLGDIELQYALTPDRRYLMRVYYNTDAVLEGKRIRSGVGLSYQRSVDSFWELFKLKKKQDSYLRPEQLKNSK